MQISKRLQDNPEQPRALVGAVWIRYCLALFAAATLVGTASASDSTDGSAKARHQFTDYVELAPFEVKGEELSITVYARSNSDRRYAERFAESVVEVSYETIGKSTGHGLVIVGDKGEPHPIFVFRRFLELDGEGRLANGMSEHAQSLRNDLQEWEEKAGFKEDPESMKGVEFETIIKAIPLPLEGISSALYLLAWSEDFDEERVKQRMLGLDEAALATDQFSKYDWVFYLPPRNAFKKVLKEILPAVMKEAELGFFKRAALRGAIFTFKPMVNDAIEGMRKGMLFLTVLRAKSGYQQGDIDALTQAYMLALMPHGKLIPGKKHDRAIEAIEAQKIENEAYKKDPFVSPEPLAEPDLALYSKFKGEYGSGKKATHRFTVEDGVCHWQYLDWDPGVFLPAGPALLVSEDGKMTIEFILGEDGTVSAVEERWVRRKNLIPSRSD